MKKKIFIIVISIILFISLLFIGVVIIKDNKEKKLKYEQELLLDEINSHYNKYVIVNKDTKLYVNNNNEFIESGNIYKDTKVILKDTNIDINTKYFLIDGIDMYISYEDVDKIEEYKIDKTYLNYIYFNKNITTKDLTNFYDYDNNLRYKINNSFDFKILVMDSNRYGVIYNDELLYVNEEDVDKIYDNHNTDEVSKNKIRTLTYHFIYDPEITYCNQSICQTFEQFESHLKYIKENNYFSLRMIDLELYMDGKIRIPEKSIVMTIDDATIFDLGAIDLLEEYQVNATIFVITGLKDDFSYLESEYLDSESHTENMHNQYECAGYGNQGGGILCLDEEYVLSDLKKSQDKLKGSYYFAYPFFDFNDRAISLLKQAGFKMAFIGQYDTDGYSYPGVTDKFKLRRKTIFSDTTMNEFIEYLK